MECFCLRHGEVPGTSKLFTDLIQHFDRVSDLYPYAPNSLESLITAAKMEYPDDRRAALVRALTPLNEGNPSLERLAQPGTVAIVTGQQVGLFSGPSYTVYKALTAIKAAKTLTDNGVPAVPVFWLATEDHDFAEIDHTWVFGADQQPVKIQLRDMASTGSRPAGEMAPASYPLDQLRSAMNGLPFVDEVMDLVTAACQPGATMGHAFGQLVRRLFEPYGLLLIDPMDRAIREIAAPLMRAAVERMPELVDALIARSKALVDRGYHAQVLVDSKTSLAFLLEGGERLALKRNSDGDYVARHHRFSLSQLADHAAELSPNALLRPVLQDYLLPTAAYIGGPAELAYLAQSQVIYQTLGEHQPAAFPRAGFTLIDASAQKRMKKYGLSPTDLFTRSQVLHDLVSQRLVPSALKESLANTKTALDATLQRLDASLVKFDPSLSAALATSRRKIEYQIAKMGRKTAAQMMRRDEQAQRDAAALSGLVFPETHLQERLYSILPFLASHGQNLIGELYDAVRIECADHQWAVV